ncbi:MAG: hypothetical protein JO199_07590 [Candidatus Eremiobacteraeota bacterium]|nr:hypothetical protein [Candidatus Eremiobacteraeota bacterium]
MASLSSPVLPAVERRQPLDQRISAASVRRLMLCLGPADSGKSSAVRAHLTHGGEPFAVLLLRERETQLWRVARALADALWVTPGLRRSFAAIYDQFAHDAHPQQELARWFGTHLRGGPPIAIAIDNAERVAGDPAVVDLLTRLIEREDNKIRWIVCARNAGLFPIPRWMAAGIMEMPVEAEASDAPPSSVLTLPTSLRGLLRDALLLPSIDCEVLSELGHADARASIEHLEAEYPHFFEPLASDRLLRERAIEPSIEAGENELAERGRVVGEVLERRGRDAEALAVYERCRCWTALTGLVERRGLELTESGAGDVVMEALRTLPPESQYAGPAATALRALAESRKGRTDTAEAWFLTAIDEAAGPIRDRIDYLYACDIMRRHRVDCIERFERLLGRIEPAREFAAEVRSAASEAYIFVNRRDEARQAIDAALSAAERSVNQPLRARVLARAAYTALFLGEDEKAQRLALESARIAEASGLYQIATGAYSVLYMAAYEDDRVLDALRYVGLLAESAVRCGNLDFHLYGLIAAHGIETERRNVAGLRQLYASLREFEVQYDSQMAVQELVPSEALHATWERDFERAYSMLAPTVSLASDLERRALRAAEVAPYAAAAGKTEESLRHLDALNLDDLGNGIYAIRAMLDAALARALVGEPQAAAFIADAAPASRPRSQALKRATLGVIAFWQNAAEWNRVAAALEELDAMHWGGFGAMLAALPAAPP